MLFKEYDDTWLDKYFSRDCRLSWLKKRWWLIGLLLIGLHFILASISPQFAYGLDLIEKPVLSFVVLELLACALFFVAVWSLRGLPDSKTSLLWVIVVGIVLRAVMLTSTPILEDDFYRYLWDGAVVANGMNPYIYAPEAVVKDADEQSIPPRLKKLAEESSPIIERINHPTLSTIYPPVAQAAFALAYRIRAWDMIAWRAVLFFFDGITLLFVIALLRQLNLPEVWSLLYWWNPLLIKEIFNSGHMDVIVLPFVLGALFFTIRRKSLWAVGSLALAVGAKIWPVVLLPLVLRPLFSDTRRLVQASGLFLFIILALFYPVLISSLGSDSGFVAYSQRWEMNDALFMFLVWISEFLVSGSGQFAARIFSLGVLVFWVAWLVRSDPTDSADFCRRFLLIVAALFLLGPAQFPWYYVWLLPFLAIQPRFSLLLLTAMLPLYYLRFFFDARNYVGIFDSGIVWLEYIPVWYLLAREWFLGK